MEAAKLELAAYADTLTELINKIGKIGFFKFLVSLKFINLC